VSPVSYRRPGAASGFFSAPIIAIAAVIAVAVVIEALWGLGLLDLSRFRSTEPSTAGLVAIPTPAKAIPAYTRVNRDHLWDVRRNRLSMVYLPPRAVTREMLTNVSDVIGRVLDHDKNSGYVFTDADFLPKGTREGLVAGIPAGKRAVRIPADRVDGVFGLHAGDRFDLVATMPIDASRSSSFNVAGVYSEQLAVQARLSNWQKQATVRVLVQSGVIVEPMATRQVPVFQAALTHEGGGFRMRPVQEVVIAIDPDEVARLTEALAVEAKVSMVPRSGRPDDPVDSTTPDLHPVSPFTAPGSRSLAGGDSESADADAAAFTVVETIMGQKRALTAVPRP
jgi:Flp pilus assembly protein CpaB